jgi:hypothetical protein
LRSRRITYTSHALLRLKIRGIDEIEVSRVMNSPSKLYFDSVTGALVAIGPRATMEGHWLIVIYTIRDEVTKVITVIDVTTIDKFIKKRVEKNRWVKVK